MASHIRSSSRPPSAYIATPISLARAANPVTQPLHLSESGPRKGETPSSAKPFLLHRSHSTTARSPHAARPIIPDSSEIQSSRGQTASPSPSLSSSQSVCTTLADSTASYATPPLGASPASSRSAPARRQPASRSSHGIETSSGPPPALITQRSYTTEVARRRPAPAELVVSRPTLRGRSQTDSRIDSRAQRRNLSVDDFTRAGQWRSPSVKRRETEKPKENMDALTATQQSPDEGTDRTLHGLGSNDPSPTSSFRGEPAAPQDERSSSLQEDEHSGSLQEDEPPSLQEDEHSKFLQEDEYSKSLQEDLFLNLANSDTLVEDAADVVRKSDRKSDRRHVSPTFYLSYPLDCKVELLWIGDTDRIFTSYIHESSTQLMMNSLAPAYQPHNSSIRRSHPPRDRLPAEGSFQCIRFHRTKNLRIFKGAHPGTSKCITYHPR